MKLIKPTCPICRRERPPCASCTKCTKEDFERFLSEYLDGRHGHTNLVQIQDHIFIKTIEELAGLLPSTDGCRS